MSEKDLGPTCDTCLAFHADSDARVAGECRQYAPKPCTTETLNWPVVDGDDWCLQHRQTTAPFELTFVPVSAPIGGGAGA